MQSSLQLNGSVVYVRRDQSQFTAGNDGYNRRKHGKRRKIRVTVEHTFSDEP